ncbi:MAG: hypothetical protein AAB676_09810 [Verrucomicrobiota bacterium]
MIATYELEEAQRKLPHLVRQAAKGDTVAVAEGDETVAYVVAKEHYESLIETIELIVGIGNSVCACEMPIGWLSVRVTEHNSSGRRDKTFAAAQGQSDH